MNFQEMQDATDEINALAQAANEAYGAYLSALQARNEAMHEAEDAGMAVQTIATAAGITRQAAYKVLNQTSADPEEAQA